MANRELAKKIEAVYSHSNETCRKLVRQFAHGKLFGTLTSDLVHHRVYHTHDEARPDLFFYIEPFYNRRRRA
jgi:hypothetical protein